MAGSPKRWSIRYQGRPCRGNLSYTRSTGMAPDQGYVTTFRRLLGELRVRAFEDGLEYALLDAPAPAPPAVGLHPAGAFELRSSVGPDANAARQVVRIDHAYVLPDAIEVTTEDHGPRKNHEAQLMLTDARALADRGRLLGAINVLRQAAAARGDSSQAQRPSPGAGGRVALATDAFQPGSLRGGRPWTLGQVLREKLLPALPGHPRLRRMPPAFENAQPRGLVWEGDVPPGEALEAVLAEYGLEIAWNHDGSASLWRRGEGGLVLEDGSPVPARAIRRDQRSFRFGYRPRTVCVLGGRTVQTFRIDNLEAVVLAPGGAVKPLEVGIREWGVTSLEVLGIFLATQEAQTPGILPGVSAAGVQAILESALKWFRIPGAAGDRGFLPPLVARAEVDAEGRRLPILVESQRPMTADRMSQAPQATGALSPALTGLVLAGLDAHFARDKDIQTISYTLPFGPVGNGEWQVHPDLPDVIAFRDVQGRLLRDGVLLELGTLMPSRVRATFGAELKVAGLRGAEPDNFYASFWSAEGGTALRVAALHPDDAPLTIRAPELVELRTLDGRSNIETLHAMAGELAADELGKPESEEGHQLTLAGFWPVQTNGVVRSVTWTTTPASGGREFPSTLVSFGSDVSSGRLAVERGGPRPEKLRPDLAKSPLAVGAR